MIDLEDGSGHGRVMHQVIAVGEDSAWMVAAQHPNGDKEETLYYYFSKADDSPLKNADEIVKGPFSKVEFAAEKKRLGLPEFLKRF